MSSVTAAGLSLNDLLVFAKDIEKLNTSGDSMNAADKGIISLTRKYHKTVQDKDYIKTTRLDGDNLSYIVAGVEKDVVGFRGYVDEKLNSKTLKDITPIKIKDSDISVSYASELLKVADEINTMIPSKVDIFLNDLSELNNILASDRKSMDYISKVSTVAGNTVYYTGMTAFLLGSAFLTVASGGIVDYALAMKGMSEKLAILLGQVIIGGVQAAHLLPIHLILDAIRKFIKTDDANTYTAINSILDMRAKLTIRYANDALFGLNKLVDDLISTASIIIDSLENKEK